jgi:hypothetical protein
MISSAAAGTPNKRLASATLTGIEAQNNINYTMKLPTIRLSTLESDFDKWL